MEVLTVPKHLIVSEGRIYPKSEGCLKNYTPKVIQYKHTIRVITPFNCGHQDEKDRLNSTQQTLEEKKKEIERLRVELQEKIEQLEKKDQQILKLRENTKREYSNNLMTTSIMENKLQRSEVTDIFRSNVQPSGMDGCFSNFSSIKSSFILDMHASKCIQPINEYQYNSGQTLKIEQEFANIEKTMSELANVLSKPKRKYEFFLKKKEEEILKPQPLPDQIQKLDINLQINSKQEIQTSHVMHSQPEDEGYDDESMQNTSTNQSLDTTNFLEQAISEHQLLKQALIELEQSTKQEMEQMRQYYENQIQTYRKMLEEQRAKHGLTNTHLSAEQQLMQYSQRRNEFTNVLQGFNKAIISKSHIFDND